MGTNSSIYYTAFYGIEDDTLYAAVERNKTIIPTMPVKDSGDAHYSYICTLRRQNFVDAVFNDIFVNSEDPEEKFSITLQENDVVVCSDGRMVFALALNDAALHDATKQIYENLDRFKVPALMNYEYDPI